MATMISKHDLTSAIQLHLQQQLNEMFDEEFEKMVQAVKVRRAELIAGAAAKISRTYSIETRGAELVITVREIK